MLEVASEGIHVVDERGVTVVYNKAASELDGLLPEEVLGKHVLDVFPSLTQESSTLLRVLRTGIPEIAKQQTFTNYKGKTITTINSTYPITHGDEIIGACELSTDITRIKGNGRKNCRPQPGAPQQGTQRAHRYSQDPG